MAKRFKLTDKEKDYIETTIQKMEDILDWKEDFVRFDILMLRLESMADDCSGTSYLDTADPEYCTEASYWEQVRDIFTIFGEKKRFQEHFKKQVKDVSGDAYEMYRSMIGKRLTPQDASGCARFNEKPSPKHSKG